MTLTFVDPDPGLLGRVDYMTATITLHSRFLQAERSSTPRPRANVTTATNAPTLLGMATRNNDQRLCQQEVAKPELLDQDTHWFIDAGRRVSTVSGLLAGAGESVSSLRNL